MTNQLSVPERFSWQSLGMWVGLTTAGFILAGGTHIQVSDPTKPFRMQDIDLSAALVGFVLGAVSGLVIGSLQWLVLKSWTPNARLWIPLNALGFGLVHAMNDAVHYRPLDLPFILMIGGILLGLTQSIALRRALSRAYLWVPVAACAWFLGLQFGFAWLSMAAIAKNPLAELVTVFGTAGLTIRAITGVALKLLTADPVAAPQH